MFQARQGDVFIVQVDEIPAEAKVSPRDKGRLILAYGEVTGHVHQLVQRRGVALAEKDAVMLTTAESATFIRLTKKAQLVHEEHATIDIPVGTYKVIRQVEHTPWGIRQVAD